MSHPVPAQSLASVQAFFTQGTLGEKHDATIRLQAAGDTMLFAGSVRWTIFVTEVEQRLRGASASMDDAFTDIRAALSLLIRQHGAAASVVCSVEKA